MKTCSSSCHESFIFHQNAVLERFISLTVGSREEREKKRQNERAPPSNARVAVEKVVAFFALLPITGPNSPRLRPCFVTILISRALAYYVPTAQRGVRRNSVMLKCISLVALFS